MQISVDVSEKLFPNLATVLVQLASTIILLLILKKFLWKPVRKYLADKAALAQKPLNDAIEREQAAEKADKEARDHLAEAREQAKQIVARGEKEGQKVKDDLIAQGQNEHDTLVEAGHKEIAGERARMESEMTNQAVDIAMAAAEKLIGQNASAKTNRAAVSDLVKELNENGG